VPERTVLVTGTTTGVGKTWLLAAVAGALAARGLKVAARKPAQSFDPSEGPSDSEVLAGATGEDPGVVCPVRFSYPIALAPPMAARALGRPAPRLEQLLAGLRLPAAGVAFVEGVGGPRSPLADGADTVALARALRPDAVVLVGDAALGAVNAVLLCADALEGLSPLVFLNRFDPLLDVHARNRRWLERAHSLEVFVRVPVLANRLAQIARPRQEARR